MCLDVALWTNKHQAIVLVHRAKRVLAHADAFDMLRVTTRHGMHEEGILQPVFVCRLVIVGVV